MISHREVTEEAIRQLRQKVQLNPEIHKITGNGNSLSGGEKKKLLMMKSFLREDASVVILDEIDAGLDGETKKIMKEMEDKLLEDPEKIVIKISHIDLEERGYHKVIQL